MLLGAWIDVGVSEQDIRQGLAGLAVSNYTLVVERTLKQGISCTKATVDCGHEHHHRHLPDILRILDESDLPTPVVAKSREAFTRLAEAEARVHGTTPDKIHFHEVGAVDAIVDIVGSMLAWYLLGEPTCIVSPIEVSGGTVACDHGLMPVPAPATALLLEGFPTYASGVWGETVTPTGAAILTTLATPAQVRPFVAHRTGYGAGTKDLPIANVLRVQLGEWAGGPRSGLLGAKRPGHHHPHNHAHDGHHDHDHGDGDDHSHGHGHGHDHDHVHAYRDQRAPYAVVEAHVIEANIDDMTPELAGYVTERLLARGAMDTAWSPLTMKKNRPAMQLQVICGEDKLEPLVEEIVRQTTTIGLRCYPVEKVELRREWRTTSTPYGDIPVKLAYWDEEVVNLAPEFNACKAAAEATESSLKQVYVAAVTAAQATLTVER